MLRNPVSLSDLGLGGMNVPASSSARCFRIDSQDNYKYDDNYLKSECEWLKSASLYPPIFRFVKKWIGAKSNFQ